MKQFAFLPALFSIDAAAHYAGVSRSMILQWLAEGRLAPHPLPPIRGRSRCEKIVFTRDELDRCLGLPTVLLTGEKR
jgi:hypothetical protein